MGTDSKPNQPFSSQRLQKAFVFLLKGGRRGLVPIGREEATGLKGRAASAFPASCRSSAATLCLKNRAMDSKVTVSCVCWVPRGRSACTPQSSLMQTREVAEALAEHKQRCREAEASCEAESKRERRRRSEKLLRQQARAAEESGEEDSESDSKEAMEEDGQDGEDSDDADDEVLPGVFGVFDADAEAALSDPSLKHMQEIQDEEEEANVILPEDLVLVAANVEQEVCSLEVYVHDMGRGALYVHHDIWCGSFPICLEWIGQYSNASMNLVAVGSFDCEINLWNLDTVDALEPLAALGAESPSTTGLGRKGKQKKGRCKDAHQGPVMCMHAPLLKPDALASSSADETVKVWDLNAAACVHTYRHHKDKVQGVQWHPQEATVFLSASFDRTAKVVDAREPKAAATAALTADAEVCAWNFQDPHCCLVSSEDGVVSCFDIRRATQGAKEESCLWRLQAHAAAATGLQLQKGLSGAMVTCGVDEVARVWDLRRTDAKHGGPTLVFERNLKAGSLYCCRASDVKGVFGFGGEQVVVWDLADTDVLVKTFCL